MRRQGLVAWLLILPFLAAFAVFMIFPLLGSFAMSFTDLTSRDAATPFAVDLVGFEQYAALFADERFRQAMLNTAYFVGVGIPITLAVGLGLAVAVDAGIHRLQSVWRIGFFAPVVTSIVAVAIVWRFMLQSDGLVNSFLASIGIDGPQWLSDPLWAMPSIIAMTVWRNAGLAMIIFLAGLQAIPRELREAAAVDGANGWTRFRRITLPLLRPTVLLGAVLLAVTYIQMFEEPFVMTGGGPLGTTTSVSLYVYERFGLGDYASAAAGSYVLFIATAAIAAVWFRMLRPKVVES